MTVTKNIGLKPERQTMTVGNPVYLDAAKAPFSMHGLCEPYRRVPEDVAKNTSRDLENLGAMTAGGRIRTISSCRQISQPPIHSVSRSLPCLQSTVSISM